MGFADPLLLLMAFDALKIHHFFRFQGARFLQFFNGFGFLGKDAVADIAVFDSVLMLDMGKGYIARSAARYAPLSVHLLMGQVVVGHLDAEKLVGIDLVSQNHRHEQQHHDEHYLKG